MKKLIIVFTLTPFLSFAQNKELEGTVVGIKNRDINLDEISVNYSTVNFLNPIYFIDGQMISELSIEPIEIENIQVIKNDSDYPKGRINVSTKNKKPISSINLKELLDKNTNVESINNVFYINNRLIDEKATNYYVDENSILSINIKEVSNSDLKYNLIEILTKTKGNVEKPKNQNIRIRGSQEI